MIQARLKSVIYYNTASNYEWQIVQSKNAYYDLSDDDSSLDNRFW